MDPVRNPYAPGAGTPPPELAGRDDLRETVRIALARIREGKSAKSVLMVGLRGVGKTVLLDRLRSDTDEAGMYTMWIEAPENRSLPSILAPQLRSTLLRLSRIEKAKDTAARALRGLAGFARALKVKFNDIEIGFDAEPEPGLADNGDLEGDLATLLLLVGAAARDARTAAVMFIDELQYVEEAELAALISALHRAAQRLVPITLVGAGLPQLPGRMGNAKSYAERLFDIQDIGPLTDEAARTAIVVPAEHEGVVYTEPAIRLILHETQGYPYFLQEWGKHSWDVADESPIDDSDVRTASIAAIAALDGSFFRIRFDRLTLSEKRYLRAMAELGPGPHRSGDIAAQLGRKVTDLGPIRSQLITKGMVWSPSHGDTAFTVPLFDRYMQRIMPGDTWRTR
ncbi:MAG: AAA family ATPase ['Candidatus Kapabacteria' thiocyanatum]|uniref:AAA family ATPase n=1 Tax=Candidatus Kapaibacterium thiocyanatum TaxID=1895771 RepID=A0A1M3KV92_9BACT|nr:AAA family ATPase ['Candidatus Kapabacteria' thiocyanatum]OJX56302.1 MAG: AAA family ATPase ['Candidatus Kapabacteria' thiocyanatum]